MIPSHWTYADAAEMAAALAAGAVSSVELAEAAIARIEAVDPKINAVCVRDFDRALDAARAADAQLADGERGPLLGVPMTIKESFNLAGTPTTWGYVEAKDFKPAEDALSVQRVKAAGAVILGKTNVPVGLGDWQSYNDIYGVTRNPYDLGRSPGGSSGGSSAALAAGYGALSLGSDIAGSLRVPAHFCGVFAHKPTHDLVPPRGSVPPRVPALPGSIDLAVIGPMARSAADLEALLDVVAGPDDLDQGVAYRLALPPARHAGLAGFRVIVLDAHPLTVTEGCVVSAIDGLASGLQKAGASVSGSSELLPDLTSVSRLFTRLLFATLASRWPETEYAKMLEGAAALGAHDDTLRAENLRGATMSFREWFADNVKRNGLRARWRTLFREFDAVICPVTPTPAFPHDHSPDQDARTFMINGEPHPYSANMVWAGVATLPGLPATTLPIGRSPEGLPIGAQIIGPWLEDRTPIHLARLIEREFGGFQPPAAFPP
ncbi:MAG TPA: amidase [Roseiarcus sp.]|jgi:amidase